MSDLVDQEGLAEKRRIADAIKEIEQLHAMQVSALTLWLRHRDHRTGVAQQALDQLASARQQENALLRNVLQIDPSRPAISKVK
jgi:hypothetical protein